MEPYSAENGYVQEGRDASHVPGPDCSDFPGGLATAPVTWDYLGRPMQLEFKAGFLGAEQDQESGVIRPLVGWFIANDADQIPWHLPRAFSGLTELLLAMCRPCSSAPRESDDIVLSS